MYIYASDYANAPSNALQSRSLSQWCRTRPRRTPGTFEAQLSPDGKTHYHTGESGINRISTFMRTGVDR